MKYAEVKYSGPMQSKTVRGPSGEQYSLSNPMGGSPIPKDVGSLEDLRFFESQNVYEVDLTARGELASAVSGPVESAKDALSDIGYYDKKDLAGSLGVELESSHPTGEEIDEELEAVVEELQTQMET
jgi:hypothetical protein